MKTVKIEGEEYIGLQELFNVQNSVEQRIASHEIRIIELQKQNDRINIEYQKRYSDICNKYKLNPKEQHVFEPKMNIDTPKTETTKSK